MPGVNPWKPVYLPVTREAFDKAARKARVPRRDRERAFEWIKYLEGHEGHWPSASHAVHAWVTGQLARQSHSRSTEPHTGGNHLP